MYAFNTKGDMMNLPVYLQQNPWSEISDSGHVVHYFFVLNLFTSVDQAWAILSNTSSLNQLMGLPPMDFTVDVKGKKIGRGKIAGVFHEWYEKPWDWVYGSFIRNERIFSKGFLKNIRGHFIFENDGGNLTVFCYFGYHTDSLYRRVVLSVYRHFFIRNFTMACRAIIKQTPTVSTYAPVKKIFSIQKTENKITNEFLKKAKDRISAKGLADQSTLDTIFNLLENKDARLVSRIRPKLLARETGIETKNVIEALLLLTVEGILTLSWEVICPNCHGTRARLAHLWEQPEREPCDKCSIDFSALGFDHLEIIFYPSKQISEPEERLFCSAEPGKKLETVVQCLVRKGENIDVRLPFQKGSFRLVRMDKLGYSSLVIDPDSHTDKLVWIAGNKETNYSVKPDALITIFNDCDDDLYFSIIRSDYDETAMKPGEIFGYQKFRDLFPDERLADGISIDIGLQTIVFTDIVGSSGLFVRVGATEAFARLRRFYTLTHDAVAKYNGTIVKTMGDAVLSAYASPVNALKGTVALHRSISKMNADNLLRVRSAIDSGYCLAVNLNTSIDYFGTAVNTAAKLQSFVQPDEIALSLNTIELGEMSDYLKSKKMNISHKYSCHINGIGDTGYIRIK